jgi:ribonucleotide reductase alpha subunit
MVDSIVIDTMEVDYVTKRDGSRVEVQFDKILRRIKNLSSNLFINPTKLTQKVCSEIYPNIHTSELDELAAQICASLSTEHPDYGKLSSKIIISNHHKNTFPSFTETIKSLYAENLVSKKLMDIIEVHGTKLNDVIDYERDFLIDYFGFKTLEKSYLMKIKGKIIERPQHLFMRVALGIHEFDIKEVIETYDLMSKKYFTHATPTLFNAGTNRPQLSSCFLLSMKEDSIDGIFSTLKDCAMISKWAGGIGLHVHNVRSKNSRIRGTNGISNGLVPMLRVFNNTARYVDQCIHPNTLIYTTNGPMKIQDVTLGETEIFNLEGNVETIQNVLEHPYEGEIYKIKTQHSIDDLIITNEHPIYVLKNQKKGVNYSTIKNRLEKKLIDFEWSEVKEITQDDMIAFPIPEYNKDISSISEEDCYVYGVILGDGCMNNNNTNGYISLHSVNKKDVLNRVERYFNNKFINSRIEVNNNTTRIYWSKTINMPFRYNDVYNVHKEKYINSRWLNLPIEKSKYIIKGLIDTDGCKNKELLFDNTSRALVEGLRFLCLKMGILTSGYERNRIGETHTTKYGDIITNKKISYTLRIPQTKEMCELLNIENKSEFFKFFKYENKLLTRVSDITKETYEGTLYDLQMEKEHNYLIHNGLIHNGGGKRNGSIAIYLEPWHKDIEDFLLLRKNHGAEEDRARDLFYALWIPDLFMKRVKENAKWTLFCPDENPGLSDVHSDEFEKLYLEYESRGDGTTVEARELWFKILESQIETGTPYLCFKDASNNKSNQQNLGTIKSSNLCTEIIEYSSPKEYAVCNLASIGLSNFVKDGVFDYDMLHSVSKTITKNLNKVIDLNYYPVPETEYSNKLHRPIGIGVQGLADVFVMMKIGFDSKEAEVINERIFETIYHAALETSCEIAEKRGKLIKELKLIEMALDSNENNMDDNMDDNMRKILKRKEELNNILKLIPEELNWDSYLGTYSSFIGSPMSKGLLQFDMWNEKPYGGWDWDALREKIKKYGVRNSLLLAPMPTASTSQILGNNECIEPFTSNIYIRRTLAGEFVVINKHLIKDLLELKLWNEDLKNQIIKNNGSVQDIEVIPDNIKDIYKTVWEVGNKALINNAAIRGRYICQSQSLNLFMDKPDFNKLSSMHFYSWEKGLKTGIYYLRTKPVAQAQQFTIEPENKNKSNNSGASSPEPFVCRLDDPNCEACGS